MSSVLTLDSDPNKVIPPSIKGALDLLKLAANEPTVKSFVLTSSSTAAYSPRPNTPMTITSDSWNEWAVKKAWADNPHGWVVYAAR